MARTVSTSPSAVMAWNADGSAILYLEGGEGAHPCGAASRGRAHLRTAQGDRVLVDVGPCFAGGPDEHAGLSAAFSGSGRFFAVVDTDTPYPALQSSPRVQVVSGPRTGTHL